MKTIDVSDAPKQQRPADRAKSDTATGAIAAAMRDLSARLEDAQTGTKALIASADRQQVAISDHLDALHAATAASRDLVSETTTLTQAAARLTTAVEDLTAALGAGGDNPPTPLVRGASDSASPDRGGQSLHRTRSGGGSPHRPGPHHDD